MAESGDLLGQLLDEVHAAELGVRRIRIRLSIEVRTIRIATRMRVRPIRTTT